MSTNKLPTDIDDIKLSGLNSTKGKTSEDKLESSKKERICNIRVEKTIESERIKNSLIQAGYSTSICQNKMYHSDESTGILVGINIEPKEVIKAIEITLKYWPQPKFLYLSTDSGGPEDDHDSIFFGVSASVANNLLSRPWAPNEIKKIPKNITKEEFHKLIRKRYS